MSDFILDPETGDIAVEGAALTLTEGRDAIRQRLEMRLHMVRGEWFLDVEEGTDYYGKIFGKQSFISINAELVRVILTTEGIDSILEALQFNVNATQRILDVAFKAKTVDNEELDVAIPIALSP